MRKGILVIITILLFIGSNAQTTAIPDTNFEQELINLGLDGTIDGVVLTANIDTLTYLEVYNMNISDLTGIEDFSSLELLTCYDNQLTSLNVTQNSNLFQLDCGNNQISNLDISNNLGLTYLACFGNPLAVLDVTQNVNLEYLYCTQNSLSSLNISQNPNLIDLYCGQNLLTNLNTSQNNNLVKLLCNRNAITSLDFTQNSALTTLSCYDNQLSYLDLSQNTVLSYLSSHLNLLTCLNVKNGNNFNFTGFTVYDNPNLSCIEVDDWPWSTSNWTLIDIQNYFSTDCSNSCSTVGIDEHSFSKLSLYPNPTQGKLTIDLGETTANVKTILTNSLGQVISIQEFEATDYIDIAINAPKGLYYLKLETINGETRTLKVIKE